VLELNNVVLPTDVLIGETINETVGQIKRLSESGSLSNHSFFLGFSLGEVCSESVHLSDNCCNALLHNSKLFCLLISFSLGFIGSLLQWLDLLVDIVVTNDVDDPISQVGGS